jgi:periplasmic protein TonB
MLNYNQKESRMNDIIFAHRNKSYGAYAMRINYNSIVTRSLIIASVLVFSGFFLASKFSNYDRALPKTQSDFIWKAKDNERIFYVDNNPKKEETKTKEADPPKTDPPKQNATDNQVSTKIKDDAIDKDIKQDSLPPVVKKDDSKLPSGDPSDPNTGMPTSKNTGNGLGGNTENNNSNKPFIHTEEMPEFPNGNVLHYLLKQTVYPIQAKERSIQQDFSVRFTIDENGKVINPEILNPNIDPSLEAEALRVIKSMPQWKPGKNNGKTVKVYCVVPFRFRLKN